MLTRHRARGFTLIEAVVVIAVIGLLVMAAGPSISTWIRNTQIRGVASSIQMGLMKARSEAIRRNQPVQFSLVSLTNPATMDTSCALSAASPSWVVSRNDPTSHCDYAPSPTATDANDPMIVEAEAAGPGAASVTVNALQSDGSTAATTVTFNGFGRVADASTAIARIDVDNAVLGSDYRRLRIEVGSGGTIRMCDVGVTASNDPRKCD